MDNVADGWFEKANGGAEEVKIGRNGYGRSEKANGLERGVGR